MLADQFTFIALVMMSFRPIDQAEMIIGIDNRNALADLIDDRLIDVQLLI